MQARELHAIGLLAGILGSLSGWFTSYSHSMMYKCLLPIPIVRNSKIAQE
jgi:hypothetical protein